MMAPMTTEPAPANGSPLDRSPLVAACRGEPVPHTPVWFMRQAGRSLPEYRALRAGIAMLEACRRPDLVCEITLQPVRRHGVDAAILFSDIVVPLHAAGVDVDIVPGVGPVVAEPVRTMADVDRLPALHPADVAFVAEAVRLLVARARRDAADRLRRRAVHAGLLPRRGRPVAQPRQDQGADVRRAGRSGTRCAPGSPQITADVPAGADRRRA